MRPIERDPEYQRHLKEYFSYEFDPIGYVCRRFVMPAMVVICIILFIVGWPK
jgi:hypothetical protein